jgi:leucyl aminopeptidase
MKIEKVSKTQSGLGVQIIFVSQETSSTSLSSKKAGSSKGTQSLKRAQSSKLVQSSKALGSTSSAQKQKVVWHHPEPHPLWETWVTEKTFTGFFKETFFLRAYGEKNQDHLLFVGLGQKASDHESWRQAGASAYQALVQNKIFKATLNFSFLEASYSPQHLQACIEGFGLADYKFDELKSKKSERPEFHLQVLGSHSEEITKILKQAQILIDSVCIARRLGDLPGNYLTPTRLGQEVSSLFKGSKAKVTLWDQKQIRKERLGGLLAVAQGSEEAPCFIKIEYQGSKKSSKGKGKTQTQGNATDSLSEGPLVFVGKGLTFDSGGISIKPSAGMEEMKFDMCGAAAVIGTLYAIVQSGLPVDAVALIPATENMPGGRATKPGDVYTARNGKTVEVNNTDAEGRLILGEALVLASELNPKWIVDAATLTGAMSVALGNLHTGYFTRSHEMNEKVKIAAQNSGEWVWPMPLCDQHVEDIKGTYADLNNISSGKGAGSATAAAFLEQFVREGLSWVHFDIAGTAWAVGNRLNYSPSKGASGVMVRTFFELAKKESQS